MARHRDFSLAIALGISLAAHAGLFTAMLEWRFYDFARTAAVASVDHSSAVSTGPILLPSPTPPTARAVKPPVAPVAEKVPPLPAIPPKLAKVPPPPPEQTLLKSVFGEPDGKGDAGHSAPGEQELRAKHAAEMTQAFLSRDPSGPGKVGDDPSRSTAVPGENGTGRAGPRRRAVAATPPPALASPRMPLLALAPKSPAMPPMPVGQPQKETPALKQTSPHPAPDIAFGIPSEKQDAVLPKQARRVVPGPETIGIDAGPAPAPHAGSESGKDEKDVKARAEKLARQAPPPPKPVGVAEKPAPAEKAALLPPVLAMTAPQAPVAPATPPVPASGGGKPGPNVPAADPAPESDSEADPFSKVATVDFRNGRVEAQFGRRIKTVRPKLLFSSVSDLLSMSNPRVLLSAKVDATGHVTKVDVYQSSGSVDLDQPCVIALYDWWFEPPKDKAGHPLPDVVVVAITFHTN